MDNKNTRIIFILRERHKGTIYMGSRTDYAFFIMNTEEEENVITKVDLENTVSLAGALMKDDTFLFLGCTDATVRVFSLKEDPKNPQRE